MKETRLFGTFIYKLDIYTRHKKCLKVTYVFLKSISLSFDTKFFDYFRVTSHQNLNFHFVTLK